MQVHRFMHLTSCEPDGTAHAEAKNASEKLVSVDNGLWLTKVWISQLELCKLYLLTDL